VSRIKMTMSRKSSRVRGRQLQTKLPPSVSFPLHRGPNPLPDNGYQVVVHEIHPGVVYANENLRVTPFAVYYGIWKEALGYRVDADGESNVFSGGTSPTQSVVNACNGCDILVHEVCAGDVGTPSGREYLSTFHTSAEELGEIAAQAHPKLLALTHILPMAGTDEAQLLR
jgi:ribonuclease BN (tRNA processing enzyme)